MKEKSYFPKRKDHPFESMSLEELKEECYKNEFINYLMQRWIEKTKKDFNKDFKRTVNYHFDSMLGFLDPENIEETARRSNEAFKEIEEREEKSSPS